MTDESAGTDSEHRDWFWMKRLPDGTGEASGRTASCQECRADASDTDDLFTEVPPAEVGP